MKKQRNGILKRGMLFALACTAFAVINASVAKVDASDNYIYNEILKLSSEKVLEDGDICREWDYYSLEDFNGKDGITYDEDTLTLELNNCDYGYTDLVFGDFNYGNLPEKNELTINVKGNNTIYGSRLMALCLVGEYSVRFVGDGVINFVGEDEEFSTVRVDGNVTIDGPTVNIIHRKNLYCSNCLECENLEMLSGSLNFDIDCNAMKVYGEVHLKGGNVNVKYIYDETENAWNRYLDDSFICTEKLYLEGATLTFDVDTYKNGLIGDSGTDYNPDNTEFYMTSGNIYINAKPEIIKESNNLKLSYQNFINVDTCNISGGNIFIKYNTPKDLSNYNTFNVVNNIIYAKNTDVANASFTLIGEERVLDSIKDKAEHLSEKNKVEYIKPYVINGPKVGEKITDGEYIYNVVKQSTIKVSLSDDNPYVANRKVTKGQVGVVGLANKNTENVRIYESVSIDDFKYNVVSVGGNAFTNNTKIKKVVIGVNVTKIGSKAFFGCTNLNKVTINSKNITTIGNYAFYRSKGTLVEFSVPSAIKTRYRELLRKAKTNNYVVR